MDHRELAAELFLSDCNCAQAVLEAFGDVTGLEKSFAAKLASSFGGGMGRMREVCGAVSGMLMALGLHQGYTDPKDKAGKAAQYEVIRALADEFKRENGSIICRELLGLDENCQPKPPEDRTAAYYAKRPCAKLCQTAGEIFERYVAEHPEDGQ